MNHDTVLLALTSVQALGGLVTAAVATIILLQLRRASNLVLPPAPIYVQPQNAEAPLAVPPAKTEPTPAEYEARGMALARMSVGHAAQVGDDGSPEERLQHALSAFRLFDQADNGKRDYPDNKARVMIEAAVAELKQAQILAPVLKMADPAP
jgi:hypothetical protein